MLGTDQELNSKITMITILWLLETSEQKTRQLLWKWGKSTAEAAAAIGSEHSSRRG